MQLADNLNQIVGRPTCQIGKRVVEDIHVGFYGLICCANLTLIR
jgi:hypothetical protein